MGEPSLDRARRDAGLSVSDLWIRYFGLGGAGAPIELEAYLQTALEATAHEHNLIVHAINERHVERGGDHPVPYRDDPADVSEDELGGS